MMDSFFSMFPKGLFGQKAGMEMAAADASLASSLMLVVDESGRKRGRDDEVPEPCESPTPALVATSSSTPQPQRTDSPLLGEEDDIRPLKRFRGEFKIIPVTPQIEALRPPAEKPVPPLSKLPEDVLSHCLCFLGSVEDRFALQCTSKQFRKISNSDEMLSKIQVGGDRTTGLHGIIQEHDTPEIASKSLAPFEQADNLEAIYMLGIIKSYCHQDVEAGICSLKYAASKGYVRASYALGLALRDSQPCEASKHMQDAADKEYIPALQELLPARKMKAKYGEPKADELRLHLDPLCLNRLLSRHYVQSAELRELNTSHCWNPLCGRWAFKALGNSSAERIHRRPLGFAFRHSSQQLGGRSESSVSATSSDSLTSTSTNSGDTSAATASARHAEKDPTKCDVKVSRMKMCSRCCRAKYCSKLCQVYDWRSGRHKMECQFL